MRRLHLDHQLLPGAARLLVAQACRDASTGPVCEESAVLMTSEVVTNAIVHGGGCVDIAVEATGTVVRVEVGDAEPHDEPTVATDAGGLAERGRGMGIVGRLSSAWGVCHRSVGGKRVWFEIPCRP